MQDDASTSWRDRIAISGSIAFHLLVLALLLAFGQQPRVVTEESDERGVLGSILRIEHRPPIPSPPPRPVRDVAVAQVAVDVPAPVRIAPLPKLAPVVVAHANSHAQRPLVVRREEPYRPPKEAPRPSAPARRLPIAAPPRREIVAAAPAASTAEPTPRSTPAEIDERQIGIGNLGETWPARPMPGMLDALRAKIGAHAVVRIELDEHGRPTNITIVSIDDPAQRGALQADLAAASYIPARCNGLDCAETLTLRI